MSKEEEQTILLNKILDRLDKVNTEVACWRAIFEQAQILVKTSDNHEKRLNDMEKSRLPLAAASAIAGGVLSHIIKIIF